MYESEKATLETYRVKFESQMAGREVTARETGGEYLTALGAFVNAFNVGPGADSQRMGSDTTGTLHRLEDHVVWAEGECHRVRTALTTLP